MFLYTITHHFLISRRVFPSKSADSIAAVLRDLGTRSSSNRAVFDLHRGQFYYHDAKTIDPNCVYFHLRGPYMRQDTNTSHTSDGCLTTKC